MNAPVELTAEVLAQRQREVVQVAADGRTADPLSAVPQKKTTAAY